MRRRLTYIGAALLAVATLACGFSFELPSRKGRPADARDLMTRDLQILAPRGEPVDLQLAFAAGELRLRPGAEEYLIDGTAYWNIGQLEPAINADGNQIVLASGEVQRLNDFDFNFDFDFGDETINRWDLSLAPVPMDLTISAGAYQGDLELGGLSLRRLEISSGASDVQLSFSEPNKITMQEFSYNTGASSVELSNLANARFDRMRFQGGAGDFTLDMGQEILGEAEITVDAALSSVVLIVPEDANVDLTVGGALTNVDVPAGFSQSGDDYTLSGSGPSLSVRVQVGAGNVEVRHP